MESGGTDRRELILSRLDEIFKGIPGVVTAVRNRGALTNDKLPAIYLLDADEHSVLGADNQGARRPTGQPIGMSDIVQMLPEIYLQLPLVAPHNQNIGVVLNAWRRTIIKAILEDASLAAYVSNPQGTIRYLGFLTSFGRGRGMDGMLQIEMAFFYPHIMREL